MHETPQPPEIHTANPAKLIVIAGSTFSRRDGGLSNAPFSFLISALSHCIRHPARMASIPSLQGAIPGLSSFVLGLSFEILKCYTRCRSYAACQCQTSVIHSFNKHLWNFYCSSVLGTRGHRGIQLTVSLLSRSTQPRWGRVDNFQDKCNSVVSIGQRQVRETRGKVWTTD